jgi:superfamily II DNA or RNA helicase
MSSRPLYRERSTFPTEMGFQGRWRTYQVRLLDSLHGYLDDDHVHIVAAPGSGKTIFGIEVVRRINKRTLVLAPTTTIRDQWAERLTQQFLAAGSSRPDWVSTNIQKPRLLTIVTYQALHALCSGQLESTESLDSEENLSSGSTVVIENGSGIGNDKSAEQVELPANLSGFQTLVMDEAHHLKTEWWRTLTFVVHRLKPTVIALTATPPYDVSPFEWQRYEELCGPVDAEISIPELVLQGDLSPHQDYLYFTVPTADFRAAVGSFVSGLLRNCEFATALMAHPWIVDPDGQLEEILGRPEYLSGMVVYLHAASVEIPRNVIRSLGVGSEAIPKLDLAWLEILLTRCLYDDAASFSGIDALLRSLRRDLLQMGAIERRKVVLRNPSVQARLLTTSRTKLHSIEEIVRMESGSMKDELRCVVLTDFIRKADLPSSTSPCAEFEDIGAVPIFETLRSAGIPNIRLAVLCGSLVIVPESAVRLVMSTADEIGIEPCDLIYRCLVHDSSYSILEMKGIHRQAAVCLITAVFEQGGITVLVGTKSLLGEGWDAPAVNTLVLATFVGSYVLSNQMRGRSIRIDPKTPTKTANVWHLVCVEPGVQEPGDDYASVTRRFSAFAGVSVASKTIENGIERLGLGSAPFTAKGIAELNAKTADRALDREGLRRNWDEALALGPARQMTDGLRAAVKTLPRGFVLRNTIAALLVEAGTLFFSVFFGLARVLGRVHSDQDPVWLLAILAGIAAAVSLPSAIAAFWRLLRHGTPERSMRQIGMVVLEALRFEGSLAGPSEFEIHSEVNRDGSVYCWITGGTGRDQAIFIRALREVLRPIENPRYLLAQNRFWRFFKENYFTVPEIFGRKKEFAEVFAKMWRSRVGPIQLIYTRSPEGTRMLLRARTHSLSSAFQQTAERMSLWK